MSAPYRAPTEARSTTAVPASTATAQPTPDQDPLALRIAEILLAGYALAKTVGLIRQAAAAAGIALGSAAIEAALGLAKSAHRGRARLAVNGITPGTLAHRITRTVAHEDVYYRASFVVRAADRIQRRLDDGASMRQAIAEERPNYAAHVRARRGRIDAAAAVGTAAEIFGEILGWYRNHALDSDADCIAADGHNFRASMVPVIGYPGTVHPHCGCHAGPPILGAGWVDDAVSSLLRRTVHPVRAIHRRAS